MGKWGSLDDLGRFASNDLDRYERPRCPRCGEPAKNDWIDMTLAGDVVHMWRPGRHWCETPGCVDERGRNVVDRYVEESHG